MKIRIGRVAPGGKAHLITATSRCRNRKIANPAQPGKLNRADMCLFCLTDANLEAAHIANTTGPDFSAALDDLLTSLGRPSTLSPAGFNAEYDTERAAIAASWAAAAAPAKPTFASALANLGGRQNAPHYAKAAARRNGRRTLQPAV